MPRIIPAYAGNTPSRRDRARTATDHPRIRGEHDPPYPPIFSERGSSPHTRGTLPGGPVLGQWLRIIPAYAGNTSEASSAAPGRADHPRIRGEHVLAFLRRGVGAGSSPHTRGTRHGRASRGDLERIIPAYAGNTQPSRAPPQGARDHPRIRGEHAEERYVEAIYSGSSPHTRGTHVGDQGQHVQRRIIPAYAGNTAAAPHPARLTWDHPRIRGEHSPVAAASDTESGSSPHTRGTHVLRHARAEGLGIIPAYAGNTVGFGVAAVSHADHPRIRGEHTF